jgi:hypothetical protein
MLTAYFVMIVTALVLAMPAFACDSTEKPKVTIERDAAFSDGIGTCDLYYLYFPSSYRSEILYSVVVGYPQDAPEAFFVLASGQESSTSDRSIATMCVGKNLLQRATLTLTYTPSATPDGTTSLCASTFKYENLPDHAEEP